MKLPIPDFNKAFRDGAFFTDEDGATCTVYTQRIGAVHLPTGRVVACDPLAFPEDPPFKRRVPPGRYPVVLSIARLGNGKKKDERVACAKLRLSPRKAISWRMALSVGQTLKALKPNHYYGYGVDSGTGCFMDAAAGKSLHAQMKKEDGYFEKLIDAMKIHYRHTRDWAEFAIADSGHNLVAFSTGFGDGLYGSYWGLDRAGDAACLVTDFGVLPDESS